MAPTAADLERVLAEGRSAEESRQLGTCRITRPATSGRGPMNTTTLKYDPAPPVTVYEGPFRIPRRDNPGGSSTAAGGEAAWQVGEAPLNLPFDHAGYAEEVKVDHTVTILTSPDDPTLVDNAYGITAVADQSQATARRFRMKRVVGS